MKAYYLRKGRDELLGKDQLLISLLFTSFLTSMTQLWETSLEGEEEERNHPHPWHPGPMVQW